MWVHWAGNVVPGEVRVGKNIGFCGHIRTYNVGKEFDVCNALLLRVRRSVILAGILKLLPDAIAPEAELFPVPDGDAVKDVAVSE